MTERILDISAQGADLSVEHGQLTIRQGESVSRTPLEEVAVLIGAHPAIRYTQGVLAGLMAHNGAFIVCGADRKPSGLLLPLAGHHLHTERLRLQIGATLPCRKRLWRELVQAKIHAQAVTLERLHGDGGGLAEMARRVKPGDSANHEAQAARRYWRLLFPESGFRRDPDGAGPNALLNYGYAVLRAIVARALAGAGLHPALGIHHHNRANPYCLADDVMEPLRPVVDEAVYRRWSARGDAVDPEAKQAIVHALLDRFEFEGAARTLFDCSARTAAAIAGAFAGSRAPLPLPRRIIPGEGVRHDAEARAPAPD